MRSAWLLVLALGSLGGCGHRDDPAAVSRGPLPVGVVARVGGQAIDVAEVARIARAQGVGAAEARDIAVRDTLLAREAAARGLSDTPEVRLSQEGEMARRVLQRILAEARATPPTDAELSEASARRWLEIDRPEGFRTVHAVVRYTDKDDEAVKARGRALAEAIRAAVVPISERAATMPAIEGMSMAAPRTASQDDPDPLAAAFRVAATAVPAGGLQVVAESLPPVTAAGRLLIPGDERLEEGFARDAASLSARGALSPVVESPYGAHVIMLLERTPAIQLLGDARLARLRDDIVNERARAAEKRLLAGLKPQSSVASDAAGLLGLVAVDP
jgi:hypothetical protein